jgi:protease-4
VELRRAFERRGAPAGALVALAALVSGCLSVHVFDLRTRPLVETVLYGETGEKILLIEVEGLISEQPGDPNLFGDREQSPVARIREELDAARDDPAVRALLLRISSPGGTATASDIIYREVNRFKQERGVPVVAQLMGMATSGGYYVAMAADEVVAHPTTVTGSIGVIFLGVNVVGLMQKLGIEDQTLTAGEHKDAGSPLRRMTPEERQQIQSVLDDLHARFKEIVASGRRDLDAARIEAVADGRVFSAARALELGLVDRIGDLEAAVEIARQRAGLATARVVTYHRPREWKQNLYSRAPSAPPSLKLELLPAPLRAQGPAFLYLWAPGGL